MNRLPFLFLGLFLFAILHLPCEWTNLWRSHAVASLAPIWQRALPPATSSKARSHSSTDALFVREQISTLQQWLGEEKRLKDLSERCAALLQMSAEPMVKDLQRRIERQKKVLSLRFSAMPAQVIFRDPSSWSSILWIELGEADNRFMGRTVVARNSPVLLEGSLVGVVEYVGQSQSRVRLITDSNLVVAVRALRGEGQNAELFMHLQNLLDRLSIRSDLFSSKEEQERFIELIAAFQKRLGPNAQEELLAKGEICGCSAPLWRSRGTLLKGSGFNYDYSDEEGPPRNLRTGQPFTLSASSLASPLLKLGDLLVTSGLDGLFPPGISVAIVKNIEPLKEGSCSYDLEGIPAAGNLQDLQTLFVLPPVGASGT